ncbi:right-handed parallel beta-helix repeat-containing protein [Halomonas maura]|uniref:right-handed parallel beta-helix repeat-containing protein n=1 Tax=Halomonas maura TaxID=117606 RepID=UPI0025B45107|nr:right-handed parallel beta-helix repeat-containing protein [Halomonas maura]MDN3555271.1 hypothetical protein [Halomonas maura]
MSLDSLTDTDNALLATAGVSSVTSPKHAAAPGIRPRPAILTTSQLGMAPSGDPVTDHRHLQRFLDDIATDRVVGVIEAGHWFVHRKLRLHDGLRLHGQGMTNTVIEARPEDWLEDRYILMHLDVGDILHESGVVLSDFCLIGADKRTSDNGPLLRLEGVSDFLIERVRCEDASSYGIFVTGYGMGDFTNDIHSDFWNSTHRGVIRQCRVLRGQVGIGCEGGAQNVLIMANHTDGQALHGFRLASAYDTQLIANSAINTRNAYWIDRHDGIHVLHNVASQVERGCVYGGFHQKRDGRISRGLWITGNRFTSSAATITDAYHGDADKFTRIVKIKDNVLEGGHVRLLWSRQVDIQGNDGDGRNAIITSHEVSGFIGNNFLRLRNTSDAVMDLGRNIDAIDPPAR